MNQFGGSGSQFGGAGQDDYGFFAPTRASSSGTSQFGGAPTGTTTSAFGTAPAAVGTPTLGSVGGFGAEPYAADAAAPPRRKALKLIGVVALAAVVVVGGWFGWTRYQLSRPLTVPSSLSAMSPLDTAQVKGVKALVQKSWQRTYPDQKLAVEVYSSRKQAIILAMARGTADVEKDFADAGFRGALQPVGHAQCAQMADGLVGCERSSRTLSALVVFYGGTANEAAAALDEAWQQQ